MIPEDNLKISLGKLKTSYAPLITVTAFSLGKPIDPLWFNMSCLTCLVFSCVYFFFLKTMNLYKNICFTWISRTSAEFFFLTDWRDKRLKNTIDLLLFYEEHFYGFPESALLVSLMHFENWHLIYLRYIFKNFVIPKHFRILFSFNSNVLKLPFFEWVEKHSLMKC